MRQLIAEVRLILGEQGDEQGDEPEPEEETPEKKAVDPKAKKSPFGKKKKTKKPKDDQAGPKSTTYVARAVRVSGLVKKLTQRYSGPPKKGGVKIDVGNRSSKSAKGVRDGFGV